MTASQEIRLADVAGQAATLNISGGTGALRSGGESYIGYYGSGTLNQSGSAFDTSGQDLYIATFAGSSGTYNMSGGTAAFSNYLIVGNLGNASLNATGGAITAGQTWVARNTGTSSASFTNASLTTGALYVGGSSAGAGGTGIFNINTGGLVNVSGITQTYSGGQVNSTGGTLTTGALDMVGGTVTQSGGTFAITPGSTTGYEYIGDTHTASYIQSGGTNNLGGNELAIGIQSGVQGSYELDAGATLSNANGIEIIGASGIGTFTQTGGTHIAGDIDLARATVGTGTFNISGGTLSAANIYVGGRVEGAGGTGTFSISGTAAVTVSGTVTGLTGTSSIAVSGGTLTTHSLVQGTASFSLTGGTVIVDGGVFTPNGTTSINAAVSGANPTLWLKNGAVGTGSINVGTTHDATLKIDSGASLTAPTLRVAGSGAGAAGTGTATFDGAGTTGNATLLQVGVSSASNNGTLNIQNGAVVTTGTATIGSTGTGLVNVTGTSSKLNTGASDLTVGTSTVGSGTVNITSSGEVDTTHALIGSNTTGTATGTVNVTGSNSKLVASSTISVGSSQSNGSTGTLKADAGGTIQATSVNVRNLGTLNLANGGKVTGNVNLTGTGQLVGTGTITGTLNNAGVVAPGNSPGSITVTGDYTQQAAGTLNMQLGGTSTANYDQLIVSGTANLAGTLNVTTINSFTVHRHDAFQVIQAQSITGTFDFKILPALSDMDRWDTSKLYTTGFIIDQSKASANLFSDNSVVPTQTYRGDVHTSGAAGSYMSDVLDMAGNGYASGYVNILGSLPTPVMDRPSVIMLDLAGLQSDINAAIANMEADNAFPSFTILTAGDELFDNLARLYAGTARTWDMALVFNSFADPSTPGSMKFAWDLDPSLNVTVDKLLAVPEPATLAVGSLATGLLLRRRRRTCRNVVENV